MVSPITTWVLPDGISPLLRRGVAEAGLLHQLFGGREAFRVTRHQDQQQVGVFFQQFAVCFQQDGFFTVMGAGSDPHRAARRPLATQRNGAGGQFRGDGDIELQAAGYGQLRALQAQFDKPIAVFLVLCGDQRNAAQHIAHEPANFLIAGGGAGRQARIGDHQGDLPLMQRVNQVRPQLGFHDDHQLGIHLVEEAVHGTGQIVG